MTTTTIDFNLDAINPQSGSDGWSRTARMVILTRGSETRVWTEECLPGGGFPLLASEAHAFTVPLGVDYRPLADDKRFRDLLNDLSGDLNDEARERVLEATEDHVTDLVRSQGLPSVWHADSWLFGDGVAVVLADVIAAGSIAEFVDGVMDAAYPSDVTIIGGATRSSARSMTRPRIFCARSQKRMRTATSARRTSRARRSNASSGSTADAWRHRAPYHHQRQHVL